MITTQGQSSAQWEHRWSVYNLSRYEVVYMDLCAMDIQNYWLCTHTLSGDARGDTLTMLSMSLLTRAHDPISRDDALYSCHSWRDPKCWILATEWILVDWREPVVRRGDREERGEAGLYQAMIVYENGTGRIIYVTDPSPGLSKRGVLVQYIKQRWMGEETVNVCQSQLNIQCS